MGESVVESCLLLPPVCLFFAFIFISDNMASITKNTITINTTHFHDKSVNVVKIITTPKSPYQLFGWVLLGLNTS